MMFITPRLEEFLAFEFSLDWLFLAIASRKMKSCLLTVKFNNLRSLWVISRAHQTKNVAGSNQYVKKFQTFIGSWGDHIVASYVQCVSSSFMISIIRIKCHVFLFFMVDVSFFESILKNQSSFLFFFIYSKSFLFFSTKFDYNRHKWLRELLPFFEMKISTFTEVQIACSCWMFCDWLINSEENIDN